MVRLFWVIGIIRAFEGLEVIKPFVIQNGQNGQKLVSVFAKPYNDRAKVIEQFFLEFHEELEKGIVKKKLQFNLYNGNSL